MSPQIASDAIPVVQALIGGLGTLFNAFFWDRAFPVLTFTIVVCALYWMLAKAQRADPTFKAMDFLREAPGGKPSLKALCTAWALVFTTLVLLVRMTMDQFHINELYFYGALWSGSPLIAEALAIWKQRVSIPPQPVQQQPTITATASITTSNDPPATKD